MSVLARLDHMVDRFLGFEARTQAEQLREVNDSIKKAGIEKKNEVSKMTPVVQEENFFTRMQNNVKENMRKRIAKTNNTPIIKKATDGNDSCEIGS